MMIQLVVLGEFMVLSIAPGGGGDDGVMVMESIVILRCCSMQVVKIGGYFKNFVAFGREGCLSLEKK